MKSLQDLRSLFAIICAGLCAGTALLTAQVPDSLDQTLDPDFQQIAPKQLQPRVEDKPERKQEDVKIDPNAKVLAPSLNNILLVPDDESVKKDGYKNLKELGSTQKVVSKGVTVPGFEELKGKLKPFFGTPVSRKEISKLVREIIYHYRDANRPVVDVYLPNQAMHEGIVQIVVTETKFGRLRVEGNKHFMDWIFEENFRTESGGPVDQAVIDEDINWLNKNPFRRTEVMYEQGADLGTTDAIMRVEDRVPFRPYAGYNDSGNRITGYETMQYGFNWGNMLWGDHQLNYQHTRRKDASSLQAHSLTYIKPLLWRHTLTLLGSHSDSELAGARIAVPALNIRSRSWSLGMRYQMPLKKTSPMLSSLTYGLDFKRSENGNAIRGIPNPNTKTDVAQALVSYQMAQPLKNGMFTAGTTLIYSPGGFGGHNKKDATALDGDPQYWIMKINGGFTYKMSDSFTFVSRAQKQWASDQLAGSEQVSLGGAYSVRGYDTSEATGEEGYSMTMELVAKPRSFFNKVKKLKWKNDQAQFFWFLDYGAVSLINPTNAEDAHKTLMGTGPGLRWGFKSNVTASFEYGMQLKDSNVAANLRNTRNKRAHISLQVSY